MTNEPVASLAGVTHRYGAVEALSNVSLTLSSGDVTALLGPNGAGKTTAIRVLATLLQPDAGHARVLGHDVMAEPDAVRARVSLTG